jgi:hypothetical protein
VKAFIGAPQSACSFCGATSTSTFRVDFLASEWITPLSGGTSA